jgi:hypothetical protein
VNPAPDIYVAMTGQLSLVRGSAEPVAGSLLSGAEQAGVTDSGPAFLAPGWQSKLSVARIAGHPGSDPGS